MNRFKKISIETLKAILFGFIGVMMSAAITVSGITVYGMWKWPEYYNGPFFAFNIILFAIYSYLIGMMIRYSAKRL